MNKEEITRMAREAGVYSGANEMVFAASLERLFQAAYAAGAAAEREACAKACEDYWQIDGTDTALAFAATVRARGDK